MPRVRSLSPQTRLLLTTMLDAARDWQYGYDLSKRTGLQAGTLYPILMRLCEHDLLKAEWRQADQPSRPPRHVYRLTGRGVAVARQVAEGGVNVRLVSVKVTS